MIKQTISIALIALSANIFAQQNKPILKEGKSEKKELDIKLNKTLAKNNYVASQTDFDPSPIPDFSQKLNTAKGFKITAFDNDANIPTFINGLLPAEKRNSDLKIQAQNYLSAVSTLMKSNPKNTAYKIKDQWSDELGFEHLKYAQYFQDVKIYGSEVILHAKENQIQSLNGRYAITENLKEINVSPTVSKASAKSIVKSNCKEKFKSENELIHDWTNKDFSQWKTELVLLKDEELTLCWYMKVHPHEGEWLTYMINAHTGEIERQYSNLCKFHTHKDGESCNAKHEDGKPCNAELVDGPTTANALDLFNNTVNINTYEVGNGFYLIDGSRTMFSNNSSLPNDPVGVIWTIDAFNTAPQNNDFTYDHVSSNNNSWSKKEAVSAHYNAGEAYEYFKLVHNRESVNGNGGNVVSIVNVANEDGTSMGNAFWNGSAMFYGNGDSAFFPLGRGLDVAGHELSHGVVQATANLDYYGESGALNESFADVFGAMIDRDDWQIGEDVVRQNAFPSGALRDMKNPHNGAATGNFNAGWQPQFYNERYTGQEDNAGVHINSGIPNYAYYLLAEGPNIGIGKDKAEKIYYRALTTYLTRSSQFVDMRNAVVKSAQDLYGNGAEVNAANAAFDQVGIGQGSGGNYQNDADINPGNEFVLFSDPQLSNLYIADVSGQNWTEPILLSETNILSKPSISDDGSEIVFVGSDDNLIHNVTIDWSGGTFQEQVFDSANSPSNLKNVIISKDAGRLAWLSAANDNKITVFDFGLGSATEFDLYNPTYTQGVTTGDVLFADVMEFDFTGNNIMYDAANRITSNSAGTIEYWDIGFLNVWNQQADTWSLGEVSKLVNGLDEGVSIGNPTFSKNSPYIVAFDYIDQNSNIILGTNIETQDIQIIHENNLLGYPSFSTDDSKIIFDIDFDNYGEELGIKDLSNNKISGIEGSLAFFFTEDATPSQWGVWFSNGERILSSIESEELETLDFKVFPNPAQDELNIDFTKLKGEIQNIEIINSAGIVVYRDQNLRAKMHQLDVSNYASGIYFINVTMDNKAYQKSLIIK